MGQVKSIKGTIHQVFKSNCCNVVKRKGSDSHDYVHAARPNSSSSEDDWSMKTTYKGVNWKEVEMWKEMERGELKMNQ